jgi:hypothetical protein
MMISENELRNYPISPFNSLLRLKEDLESLRNRSYSVKVTLISHTYLEERRFSAVLVRGLRNKFCSRL